MLGMLRTFFRSIREVPMKVQTKVIGSDGVDPSERVFLEHVKLANADYSALDLTYFGTVGCRFENCKFDKLCVDDTAFGSGRELTEFVGCSFDNSIFTRGGGFTRFIGCCFQSTVLRKWTCFKAEFIDCTFTGRLQTCIFNGTVPEEDRSWVGRQRNQFRGNDFSGAELIDVAFRTGIDLSQQHLPTGPDYLYIPDAEAAINRAQLGLADWKAGTELQRLAQVIVTVQANAVADGQLQLLIRLPGLFKGRHKFPKEVVEKVISLFRGDEIPP